MQGTVSPRWLAGVFLTKHHLSAMMRVYDPDRTGHVCISEVLAALTTPLPARRERMLLKVWEHLAMRHLYDEFTNPDIDPGSVTLSRDQVLAALHPHAYPDVAAGQKTAEDVASHLARGLPDTVAQSDFLRYYADLHCTMPSDAFFVDMLQRVWQVPEADGDAKAEERVQRFLRIIREKCEQKRNARETEPQRLLRAFRYFDEEGTGSTDLASSRKVLAQLGVPLTLSECSELFQRFPHTAEGRLEYPSFVDMVYDGVLV